MPYNPPRQYEPEVQEKHWTELPFSFEAMQTKPITIGTLEEKVITGTMWIDTHPESRQLYSLCVIIPHVQTNDSRRLEQVRVRLLPVDIARISPHPLASENGHFYLSGSEVEILGTILLPQSADTDGKTAHL
ncbi:MAG: hypothetical protein U1F81_01125 [Verrucomicrobiaceae bacterium]|mgnify:CR=1 FL=1